MDSSIQLVVFLHNIQKSYAAYIRAVPSDYDLTTLQKELLVLLYNNPSLDKAIELTNLGYYSKGNVSEALNGLAKEGLLSKQNDENDARIIHLKLTSKATPLITKLQKARNAFLKQFFSDFSSSEIDTYKELTSRVINNLKQVNYESK